MKTVAQRAHYGIVTTAGSRSDMSDSVIETTSDHLRVTVIDDRTGNKYDMFAVCLVTHTASQADAIAKKWLENNGYQPFTSVSYLYGGEFRRR